MKVNDLIDALYKYQNLDVIVRIGNGLFCPIESIELLDDTIVILGRDLKLSDECTDFEPLKFEPSVEKLYIIDNKK